MERDEARTDEVLLQVERDKAVQMCTAAVEERERLRRTYENLEKKYSQEKGRRSPSSSLKTSVDRRKAQKAETKTSSSEDSDSSSLTDDTEGPASDYVHEGCRWKTFSQLGGEWNLDTEQVGRDTVHQQQQMSPEVQPPKDWRLLFVLRQQTRRTRGTTSRKQRMSYKHRWK